MCSSRVRDPAGRPAGSRTRLERNSQGYLRPTVLVPAWLCYAVLWFYHLCHPSLERPILYCSASDAISIPPADPPAQRLCGIVCPKYTLPRRRLKRQSLGPWKQPCPNARPDGLLGGAGSVRYLPGAHNVPARQRPRQLSNRGRRPQERADGISGQEGGSYGSVLPAPHSLVQAWHPLVQVQIFVGFRACFVANANNQQHTCFIVNLINNSPTVQPNTKDAGNSSQLLTTDRARIPGERFNDAPGPLAIPTR